MFYKSLKINGEEYPLAVNLTGNGAPSENTEADVGMTYMDLETEKVYIRTPSGWGAIIVLQDEVENDLSVLGSDGGISIVAYYLKMLGGETTIEGNYIRVRTYDDRDIEVSGGKLAIEEPINANHAASKGYVDGIVGNIGTALDGVIALQNSLIGGDA